MFRRILLAAGIAAALVAVGIVGSASFNATGGLVIPFAASPNPSQGRGSFKSNEDATHEKGETAAHEAAENSGQRPGGPGGCHSNENTAHETGESKEREAAEGTATCPAPGTPGATATH